MLYSDGHRRATIRKMPVLLAMVAGLAVSIPRCAAAATEVPSRWVNDGVYVRLRTRSGKEVELYTDSGGGSLILSRRAAERLALAPVPATDPDVKAALGPDASLATPPPIDPALPALPAPALIARRAAQLTAWPEQADGFLGAFWFANRIWTWDYPNRKLFLETPGSTPPRGANVVPLGFKMKRDGSRTTNFARVSIEVDGKTIDVLLDTGAETVLKPQAAKALAVAKSPTAASMIVSRIFQEWRRAHPDWRYIADAQVGTGSAMIEARNVRIAGIDVGPVWFTERPDANYDRFMSSMMDRPVAGSIRGNALRRLRMTIDFPAARAWFVCERFCLR